MKAALLLLLAATASGRPTNQEDSEISPIKQQQNSDQNENFKIISTEYVNSEHSNLTEKEIEEVNLNLDRFLQTLGEDLTEIFTKNYTKSDIREEIGDGVDDEEFGGIKETVVREFPELNGEVADEIVYRLRKNLLVTRQNLKRVLSPGTE